jgi:hypothetical protein
VLFKNLRLTGLIFAFMILQATSLAPIANAASSAISLVVKGASSTEAGNPFSGYIGLTYVAESKEDIAKVQMYLKAKPSGAPDPVLTNSSGTVVPESAPSKVAFSLNPTVLTSTIGTYTYEVVATFANNPELTSVQIISFTLNQPPVADTEKPRVDWQNSGISKTLVNYGEEVTAWARITDNVGTNDVVAYFYANSPISGSIGTPLSKSGCQRTKGDEKDGIWTCAGLVIKEKLSKDDLYSIAFDARDGSGNQATGQAIGSVTVKQTTSVPIGLIPTKVIIGTPSSVTLDSDGVAKLQVAAYVVPVDLNQLPAGRSSLDVELIFKGSGGPGCLSQPKESVNTLKEGYKFFILDYYLTSTGGCTGTFQFYGDSKYEKTDYPTFNFTVNPYPKPGNYSISQVSLANYDVTPGGTVTIFYWVTKLSTQSTSGLGAGIGEFGVDPGPFGDEYSSIGWTLGLVKGESDNGLYKSTISIPPTAKPGIYKTWVFWKGVLGPVFGPNLTIEVSASESDDAFKNFSTWVQEAQSAYSTLVMKAVEAKFGDGGYRYINLRPDPISDYYKFPTLQKFGLYKTELAKWAEYEIANLRIENFIKSEANSASNLDLQKACEIQSASTVKSLKEIDVQLSYLNQRITNAQTLNPGQKQIEYKALLSELNLISKNLLVWIEKLPIYLQSNKNCTEYSNLFEYANLLYSVYKSYYSELIKPIVDNPTSATYINLSFLGNNQILDGQTLYLDGIDSTGDGRGSIEINAFLKAYESKLMYGNQSLNYQIAAKTSTPTVCKISATKYFLGSNNPFTKFNLTPISQGECRLNFVSNISDRNDLISTAANWITNVKSSASLSAKDVSTEINDDGVEVAPEANLTVARQSNGKYTIKVDSNLESEKIEIYASKKGSKTIKFSANTGSTTQLKITTSRNLKGFTLIIKFDGEILDKLLVR